MHERCRWAPLQPDRLSCTNSARFQSQVGLELRRERKIWLRSDWPFYFFLPLRKSVSGIMRSLSFSHSPFIEGRGRDCIKGTHSVRARIYLGKWSLARSERRGRKALSNKLSHHSCIEHESLKRIDEIIFRLGFLRYILVQRFPLLLSFVPCR